MKKILLSVLILIIPQLTWGYEKGWDYQKFYEEVNWCKQSIIYPGAQDYIKAGIKNNKSEEEMRVDVISMVPVFERISNDMCYCTFNEIAKDIRYSDYQRREIVKLYMSTPRCQKSLEQSMQSSKVNPGKGKLN